MFVFIVLHAIDVFFFCLRVERVDSSSHTTELFSYSNLSLFGLCHSTVLECGHVDFLSSRTFFQFSIYDLIKKQCLSMFSLSSVEQGRVSLA